MTNPLLNPESTHYSMFDNKDAIEYLEALMSIDELKGWAKGNILKYRLRVGKKDDVLKEMYKIKTYEDYYKFLVQKEVET